MCSKKNTPFFHCRTDQNPYKLYIFAEHNLEALLFVMELFNNSRVRRQDRLIGPEEAITLLQEGEYGVLSMQTPDAKGAYGIPINYVWDKDRSIYIHCAPVGEKLQAIDCNPNVSFTVVGQTKVKPNKFTTAYESIVIKCHAYRHLPKEEKLYALEIFMRKYCPNDIVTGRKMAAKSFFRTEIVRLDIIEISGKAKRVK